MKKIDWKKVKLQQKILHLETRVMILEKDWEGAIRNLFVIPEELKIIKKAK